MFGWVEFIAEVVTGFVLAVAGYAANTLSLGFSGKWSTEGVVMTQNYVYGTYYNSDSSNVEESIIRAPRVPNIPFGLGMFVFEVWWECRTIDINKEM